MANSLSLKKQLFLSTAMVGALVGYGRRAYAACVYSGAGPTYLCSGANVATQTINANEASVSTAAGFGVNTGVGNAITITGDGALGFTDTNASVITSTAVGSYGLRMSVGGDDGGTPGTITINSNGAITGDNYGIYARNNGTGALSVTANGDVTSATFAGIGATNYGTDLAVTTGALSHVTGGSFGIVASNLGTGTLSVTAGGVVTSGIFAKNFGTGTDMTVTTGAGSQVTGTTGIYAYNYGTGALSVTANGDVTGTTANGIFARNYATGTNLTVTTGAGSQVTGDTKGIYARNQGTGALSVTANGDVTGTTNIGILARGYGTDLTITTGAGSHVIGRFKGIYAGNYGTGALSVTANGDVTGTNIGSSGIFARNFATGTGLTVTTGAAGHVTGADNGINVRNYGTGALSIIADGDVTGTIRYGIIAKNYGTNMSITTSAASHVTGGNLGIVASNYGTGALAITADGDVTSTVFDGIKARNFGTATNLTVTTGVGSQVIGDNKGIYAKNQGTGALAVTVNGDVTGTTNDGIYAYDHHAAATVTVANGGTVSGARSIGSDANTQLNVSLDGSVHPVTLTGTGGTAVQLGNQNDTLSLSGAVTIHGDVTAGGGNDTLTLGSGTVTLPDVGHKTISGFETVNVTGASVVNGNLDFGGSALTLSGAGHSLHVNGLLTAASLTIDSGGEFGGNNTLTGNLIVGNGGRLAPGNSIGTIHVVGNLTFNTGSVFQVQVDGAAADLVTATGNITIQPGVTLAVVPLGAFSGGATAFLTAGGALTGTFDTVTLNGVAATIIYDATSASFGAGGGGVILFASPSALNAQSLSMQQSSLLFGDTVAEASAASALEKEKHVWAKGLYTNSNRSNNGNYAGFNDRISGLAVGGERAVAEHWQLGFALGQLESNADVKTSADQSRDEGSFASVYATYTRPAGGVDLFSTLGLTGGYHAITAMRAVSNNGVPAVASADSNATAGGVFLQLGLHDAIGNGWSLLPKIGAAYTSTHAGGFTEHGGGLASISMNGYSFRAWKTSEGLTLTHESGMNLFDMIVKPRFDFGFSQETAAGRGQAHGSFSNATPLTLALDRSNTNFIHAGVGLDLAFSESITGSIDYHYTHSNTETRNEAKAGVSITF